MARLTPRLGNWVDGDAFFDRVHEMAMFMRAIDAGDHVSLIAQRRVGKSSLLKEAARRHGDRYTFVYVDLQDFTEPRDVVLAIAAAARADVRTWTLVRNGFERALGSLEQVGGEAFALKLRDGLGADWRAQGDRLLADLAVGAPPPVLMLDELPMLLGRVLRDGEHRPRPGGVEQADLLLSWLRRAALAHAGKLRIVVTGSIGLEPLARQAGLSGALNVYAPMLLPAWDAPVAIEALHALALYERLSLQADAAERVVELLGSCIPYHVQVVFRQLADDAARLKRSEISAKDVDRVYRTRVLAHHGHAELAHMEERLRRVLPRDLHAMALDLLTEAAVRGRLTAEAALLIARRNQAADLDPRAPLTLLFDVLGHDGYLEQGPRGWTFASRLLKDWWKARFGAFHPKLEEEK